MRLKWTMGGQAKNVQFLPIMELENCCKWDLPMAFVKNPKLSSFKMGGYQ